MIRVYVIECDEDRVAISSSGWIEVQCNFTHQNGEICELIEAIGEVNEEDFYGPDFGDIFKGSLCEWYTFKKTPKQKRIELICGERFKPTNEFNNEDGEYEILFLKTTWEKCYLDTEKAPCYMAESIGCQHCDLCYYEAEERPLMSFDEMVQSKRYLEIATDELHTKAISYYNMWG